jgi:hypothetical protein
LQRLHGLAEGRFPRGTECFLGMSLQSNPAQRLFVQAAHRATINTSKSYNVVRDVVFEPKVFAELKNAQSIVLAYDGLNPLPPTYCYLKPYYFDSNRTWFEQLANGEI